MSLILCGHIGCGKTTLGRHLAAQDDLRFVDTDELMLQEHSANNIGELYEYLGEQMFRASEAKIVLSLQRDCADVIATGGGTFTQPRLANHLSTLGTVIYLKAPENLLWQRLSLRDDYPKFLDPKNTRADFARYFSTRDRIYSNAAEVTLPINDQSILAVVEQLRGFYGE